MRSKILIVIFSIVSILLLPGYANPTVLDQTTIQTTEGEIIHIDRTKNGFIFRGYEEQIILLETFGHSCRPCKVLIPLYNRLQKKYQKNVVVIAIEVWGSDSKGLKQYADKHGIHYKAVAKVNSGKIISFIKQLTGWNPGVGVPYLMLFSPGGTIVKDIPAQTIYQSYVESLIQELLKNESPKGQISVPY